MIVPSFVVETEVAACAPRINSCSERGAPIEPDRSANQTHLLNRGQMRPQSQILKHVSDPSSMWGEVDSVHR